MAVYVNLYQIILNIFYPHQFLYTLKKIPKIGGKKLQGKILLLSFLYWCGNPNIWVELSTVAKTFHVTLDREKLSLLYLSNNLSFAYFVLCIYHFIHAECIIFLLRVFNTQCYRFLEQLLRCLVSMWSVP